ncbi:distal tail protein Dit [Clostridium sp. UBA1652]|uniref:distal tail protein Dit n=1 Tax=Clostridium sp. UBA1652 TaxID=1946348 RepID=UPI00257BD740|nr:distal tail protein Dit [Clostridium sp. UBA1652]
MKATSIIFNNRDSVEDFGLYLAESPSIPLSIEETESIVVEGRSGTLTRKLGTYKDKKIRCKFRLLSKEDFTRKVDRIIEWLNIIEDSDLIFEFDNEVKYKVKVVNCSEDIQKQLNFYGDFDVEFVCDPFKYPIYNDIITTNQKNTVLYNNGTYKSEPYIKMIGSGNITISVNGKTTIINNVSEYIELDSMYFLCKKGLTNEMLKMNGDFPIFEVGNNTISITGNVTSVEINMRTRFL